MKNKQTHFTIASFACLIFVMLGYVIKFYPETVASFDMTIQSAMRGDLPAGLTTFFSTITVIGNTLTQVILVVVAFLALYFWKQWKAEGGFVAVSGIAAACFILTFKYIYRRDRPSITHLVEAHGYSFPSGHSMGTMLIIGSLIVIVHQRMKAGLARTFCELLLACLIGLIGLSRIYLGVHYPTDVIAGFTLGFGVLHLIYPFYDQKRFELRFQGKQK
ncbi:phosphatase PAP2 family protein [Streptococcus caprae]|uniref:Phosphatase PAP2 family protein n=1 Tax=Streptococcus caprae TaxID=1640501 RepID=A0ABV8CTM2_9STRE